MSATVTVLGESVKKTYVIVGLCIIIVAIAIGSIIIFRHTPTQQPTHHSGTIASTDATGATEINAFLPTQTVYAKGEGMEQGEYKIYVVPDVATWVPGVTPIPQLGPPLPPPVTVMVGASGTFGPIVVWGPDLTSGDYDIVADHQTLGTQGVYDIHDALDSGEVHVTAGFFVIPEAALGTIGTLSAAFAAAFLKYRKAF